MLAPAAALIFAAAMALSLSVEADSYFHSPTPSATPDADDASSEDPAAPPGLAASDSTAEP